VVNYFLEKYPLENFSRFRFWGVCGVILQLWKTSYSDSMSGRQGSRGFRFNTKSAVAVPSILAIVVTQMIWLCCIFEIDVFFAFNRYFSCTILALTTWFRKTCGQRYLWGISRFAKRKTLHYDMWLIIF
jgi:hypothetical protein